jgi:hypothetical protein
MPFVIKDVNQAKQKGKHKLEVKMWQVKPIRWIVIVAHSNQICNNGKNDEPPNK